MADMTSNPRDRSFPNSAGLSGAEPDQSSHTTLPQPFGAAAGWGGSIWNNTALGTGFGSTARDSSRPRQNGGFMSSSANRIEGKTGSGSLVASSESDNWLPNRTPWGDPGSTNMPHARSSGVSPQRKLSLVQTQPSQQLPSYLETNTYFQAPRTAPIGQSAVAKPTKPLLDPTTVNFSTTRQPEPLTNGFSTFAFGQSDNAQQRSEGGSWHDASSVHSPNDDRRSIAASEYFGSSSAAPSRSGSLPPSRHGEPLQQYGQNADQYSRFAQPVPRQNSSFSHGTGRAFQERSGSIQSDSFQMLSRLSLEQEPDAPLMGHKPSLSVNSFAAPPFTPVNEALYSRDVADASGMSRMGDGAHAVSGGFTPESYANGNAPEPNGQFRHLQYDSRSAPNGTGVRQSPFYSHAHTPPVHETILHPRADQTLSNTSNIALIQSKLQGYQLQQERRNFITPNHLHHPQFQHLMLANNMRPQYGYPYNVPNGMPLNGIPSNLSISAVPAVQIPLVEAPKAPRERSQPEGVVSNCLWEFKQTSKNKRWELKDIYDHIVEFSGDQHGSRFIQQKLEGANSDEKDRVFKELQSDALQLMQDVFGNYVIQKFFEHGDQTQKRILANRMKGHVLNLSLQMYGCRVVQKALEHILTEQQALLVKELEKDVLKCVKDQNGNHVIQKAIERVPMEHIQFIIQAFRGNVGALAVHTYGCRVIQRILEHGEEPARRLIMQELHAEGAKLISDQYGNYVTQHVIEHGEPEDRERVISLVKASLLGFSKHKFASNVVEKCLIFGTDQQRREIMLEVTKKNDRGESAIFVLLKDNYGNYVLQKLLETLCSKDYEELVALLRPEVEKGKKTISGKQMIAIDKKMHRFERVDSVSSPTPQRSSVSSDLSSAPTPELSSDAISPQSSSLPSASTSTVDEPVLNTPLANKDDPIHSGVISFENAS